MKILSRLIYLSFVSVLIYIDIGYCQGSSSTISKVGTNVAQFLRIEPSARSVGMGGAFIAVANDVSAMVSNPAGLARSNKHEVMFSHVNWIVETNYDFLAFGLNLYDYGAIGLMVSTFGSGDMLVRTIEQPDGTGELFDTRDFMVGLSYSKNLTDDFSIGGNIKYINQRIWHMSASSIALDIGTLFTTPFWGINLGASIFNYGPKMRLDGRDIKFAHDPDYINSGNVEFVNAQYEMKDYDIPLIFQVGLAKKIDISESNSLLVAVDAIHPNDNFESINTGFEYSWNEMIFLRSGYKSLFLSDSEQGLTMGLGIKIRIAGTVMFKADYAYADFGRLENAQRFTFNILF